MLLHVAFASLHVVGMARASLAGGVADAGAPAVMCLPGGTADGSTIDEDRGAPAQLSAGCPLCATLTGSATPPPQRMALVAPSYTAVRDARSGAPDAPAAQQPERLVKRSRAPPIAAA